jgi:hypothetical protein
MVVGKYIMQKPVEVEALMVETPLASSYFMVTSFLKGIEDVQDISTNLSGLSRFCQDDGNFLKSDDEHITIKLLNGNVLKVKPFDYIIKEPNDYDNSYKLSVMNYNEFNERFVPANDSTESLEEDEGEVETEQKQKKGYCGVTW